MLARESPIHADALLGAIGFAHLDIATKEMLLRALEKYAGTMLFVSHDRQFLTALSNRVLELGEDGRELYDGGYREYVARTGREAPGVAARA